MTSKALDRACMSMLNCLSTLSQYSKSIHLRECGILRRLSKLAVTTPLDAPEALREDLSNMTRNRLTIGKWPAELAAETRILIASICLRKRDFLEATNSYCEASFQYSSVGKFKEGEQVLAQAQSYLSEDNKQTKGLREFMILYQRAYGLYLQGHKEEALRLARDLAQRWQVLMPNKSKTRSSYLSKTGFLLKELKDEENSRTVLQSTSPVSQEEELNIDTFVPFVKKD